MIINKPSETDLKKSDFDYYLPPELIAQEPLPRRDMSRLLTVNRTDGSIGHGSFPDVLSLLQSGDVLVINDSKVIPARIFGVKAGTGAAVECVLLRRLGLDRWETLLRPGRRLQPGTVIIFGDGLMSAEVESVTESGDRVLHFDCHGGDFHDLLDRIGNLPLPPYITHELEDKSRYQTVYAREEGSAAAPTAGLHFTPELLDRIREKGVDIVPVMLHVGLGTFRPVKEENIRDHLMHSEYFTVTPDAAERINRRSGRIVAVGTTSCRVLESASDEDGVVHPMSDDTSIFIYPGYRFKATQALITNFHLPQSTLLMLVSAFSSRELMMRAYAEAIDRKYRFYSLGDAMMIY